MTREEVERILGATLPTSSSRFRTPVRKDWAELEEEFGAEFPPAFVLFTECLSAYEFPGDIYNIASGEPSNGNDRIVDVYDAESRHAAWPKWFIPFYGIGNGDYFGLDARAGVNSQVHYWYHERLRAEPYAASFEDWIRRLPEFLA